MTEIQPQKVYQNSKNELVLVMGKAVYTETSESVVVFQDLQSKQIYVMPIQKFLTSFSIIN